MQGGMKSNLRSFMQKVFDHVKQSTKACQLNVEGNISSLERALNQDIRGMCAHITERLDSVRRDVSDPGEPPFPQ